MKARVTINRGTTIADQEDEERGTGKPGLAFAFYSKNITSLFL